MPEEVTPNPRPAVGAVADTLVSDRLAQRDTGCFTDEGAAAYLAGALDQSVRDVMRAHLDHCEACRALVRFGARGLGSGVDAATSETAPFEKLDPGMPHRIGRFTILEKIGAGGMGVVYAAFDNELDRKVALKLVRTELRDEKPEATRQAMLREAKAMAKVDHPNVITVFEVGTHEDHIYVAMELVAGGDLRTWMTSRPRTWRELLAVCRQAGLGLAAAHHAGLVHRDFKPDNVLVGIDGRVRVTDFGLARAVGLAGEAPGERASGLGLPTLRPSERLTRTGAIVGTPAYMAPEQHRGEAADARSDQFAFCVTLWEALFGERPFAGATYGEIAANVRDGNLREAPAASEVPVRVREALRRGLAKAPAERFATIDALLAELALEEPGSRRRLALLVAAPLAAAAITGGIWLAVAGDDERSCPTPQSRLAGIWDGERRDATRDAIAAVGPFGEAVAARTTAALDAYTQRWAASWDAACAASERGEQSPTMFDLRVACLMRRLHAVDAIATALAKRDPAIVAKASVLIDGRPPLETGATTQSHARAAPPTSQLLEVHAIDELLARAHGERMGGNMSAARRLAEQALADAERIGYRPSASAALLTLARLEHDAGDYTKAEKLLQRASTEAMSSSYDELAAEILTELADIVGYDLARPAEAHRLIEIARGAIERIGSPPRARVELLLAQSRIALGEGKLEPALGFLDEATRLVDQIGDEMYVIPILSARGQILLDQGRFDDAFALAEQELALRAAHEGKRHPNYAFGLETRATLHFARNAFEAGLADLAEARRIRIEALGPDTPELFMTENNAGIIAGLLGDWHEALRAAQVSQRIAEKRHGLEHPTTALAISNHGSALRELGRLDEAEPLIVQALELRKRLLGETHADHAVSLTELGELRLAQGRTEEAARAFRDAEKILLEAIGEESPLIPYATWGLGVAQLRLGANREAKATLARTLARLDELDLDPVLNARTRLALADASWKLGERPAARALVAGTADVLARLPKNTNRDLRAEIDAWLAKHK